ncbi:hypothetical protein CKJ90_32080, partial [Klebsiella pneumoniae]
MKTPQCLQTGGMRLPVSVEFLGLLDTVASVGESELAAPPAAEVKTPQCLQTGGMRLPVSVEFLGLLDTVASVG